MKQLIRETALAQTFYGKRGMKRPEARRIADIVEKKIKPMDVHELSGPLIREFVNVVLLEEGFGDWARAYSVWGRHCMTLTKSTTVRGSKTIAGRPLMGCMPMEVDTLLTPEEMVSVEVTCSGYPWAEQPAPPISL